MSANWDGCTFKEEGPWATKENTTDCRSLLIVTVLLVISGIIVKLIV